MVCVLVLAVCWRHAHSPPCLAVEVPVGLCCVLCVGVALVLQIHTTQKLMHIIYLLARV
jgi:hypothetical protein